ncbi:MAG: 2-phospho-L-lactate guanylyltransferase, partial [Actinomycetota bacterium]|nr:2-phospho-L-lactate guanylyltransferase [Actinomycetota bacterium]
MRVCAVVPVKGLRETKSRLSPILDPGCRAGLTIYMMGRVISTLREAGVEEVCVVSPDRLVLEEAAKRRGAPLRQKSRGLNPALKEGRRWAMDRGASALLVIPADLPLLDAEDVRAVLDAAEGSSVVVSPDGARVVTNALLLRPPYAIPFSFGLGSFGAHVRAAKQGGLSVTVCERDHLAF